MQTIWKIIEARPEYKDYLNPSDIEKVLDNDIKNDGAGNKIQAILKDLKPVVDVSQMMGGAYTRKGKRLYKRQTKRA